MTAGLQRRYSKMLGSLRPPEKVPPKLDVSKKLGLPNGRPNISGRAIAEELAGSICGVEIWMSRPFSSNRNRDLRNSGDGDPMNCGVEIAMRRPCLS